MSEIEKSTTVQRRTVLKGAAWSLPVVAAAVATPAHAASSTNPGCGCLHAGSVAAFSAQAVTLLNLGTVTGDITFNLDSSACNTGFFKPAYTVVGVGGTISFSDGTTKNFTLSAVSGAGTIGQISAFTSPFTVIGQINMPNDAIPPYTPKVPTNICFTFTAIFIPLLPIPQVECTYQLCYDITNPSSIGTIILGSGTVNWTDLTPSNPTLTPLS
jgi:hypothetical protein